MKAEGVGGGFVVVLYSNKLMPLLSYCPCQADPHFVLPNGPQKLPHGHPDLHHAAGEL